MRNEKWRTIEGFPEYVVSNAGRFAKKSNGKLLSTYQSSQIRNNSIKVTLYRKEGEGVRKEYRRGCKSIFAAAWPECYNPFRRI